MQNIGDFSRSERLGKTKTWKKQKRYQPSTLFQCTMANGELAKREWLVYSQSTEWALFAMHDFRSYTHNFVQVSATGKTVIY